MTAEVLRRIMTEFVLWRPGSAVVATGAPNLVIGTLVGGNPVSLTQVTRANLKQDPVNTDVWSIPAAKLGLADGVYHYWFEVDAPDGRRRLVTDPLARMVDWRVLDPLPVPFPRPGGATRGDHRRRRREPRLGRPRG